MICTTSISGGQLGAVINYRGGGGQENVICQVHMPFSLTRSRGKYLRVVGIREMVDQIEISVVCYPFQKLYRQQLTKKC